MEGQLPRPVPRKRAAPLLVGLSLALTPCAAGAQDTDRVFEGTTRVFEVQVPVNVVDRDGEPIRDLTAADFAIEDEGRNRRLTGFEVIDLDLLQPGAAGLPPSRLEMAIPAAARRHFLLLFDLSFSSPTAVLKAREAAREFVLNDLHPTDLVAVATHSVEGGARLVITFTPDRSQLALAIDTLGAPRLIQGAQRDPLRFLLEGTAAGGGIASSDLGNADRSDAVVQMQESVLAYLNVIGKQMARMEASYARGRVSSWSASMADLARLLDSVQGRKHVVYFSEGFDGRLLLGRRPDADDEEHQRDRFNLQFGAFHMVDTDDMYGNTLLQGEVGAMLEEFQRADCVIQTVDISGLRAVTQAEERVHAVGQDALFYVANETGGELFRDANNFGGQLRRVMQRSTVTYLLSFEASDVEADGGYRRLKVKVDGAKGSRVTHRKGYYAPRPFDSLHPLEKSLLAADAIAAAAPRKELEMDVLAAAFRAGERMAYVPVIIEVSGGSLVDGQRDDSLSVELYAYVSNVYGEIKDFFTQMVTLDLSSGRDAFAQAGLKYYGHLDLEPGIYLVRVLARNAETGRTGVRTASLEVPVYEEAAPTLLPPFFVERSQRWFLVREQRGSAYEKSVVYPFTVNGEPYIPAALPSIQRNQDAEVCLVAYNLGEGEVELTGRVLAEDGREIAGGSLALVERTVTGIEGLDKLRARFSPEGLVAGRYTLEVGLSQPSSGALQVNSIPISVFQ